MDHGGLVHEEPMNLPPGFRFHPTDEELIIHYLRKKAADSSFSSVAIGEADLNKCEPWDLPSMAKMGEKEWYLFCMKDRKYPTGLRTNRATQTGYWKATGKDKEICMDTDNNNQRCKMLVGMKKTLVFYKGRAPKGEKSDWVMHEFRLDARVSSCNQRNEWVICRVFKKSPGDKKSIDISRAAPQEQHLHYSSHPTDMSTCMSMRSHVTCFSSDDVDAHTAVPNDVFAEYLCPSLSLVQLLESNICPGERGDLNDNGSHSHSKASQETGITCDINPEISSVASTSAQEGPPSTSAHVSFPLAQRFWTY